MSSRKLKLYRMPDWFFITYLLILVKYGSIYIYFTNVVHGLEDFINTYRKKSVHSIQCSQITVATSLDFHKINNLIVFQLARKG